MSIDACLEFAEKHDVQVTIHTDTLNESGFVDDSIAAIKGRAIHTYHSEGAGGGHAPDIIKVRAIRTQHGRRHSTSGIPYILPLADCAPTRGLSALRLLLGP